MPGISLGISFVLNESEPDGSKCATCGELIVTKVHTLFMSLDTTMSETGFELIETGKQFCTACKPEIDD